MDIEKKYYSVKRADNISYLPLAYFLPWEIFTACPTLRKIPRCFGEVAKSERILDIIKSKQFFIEVADSVAAMTFPHFGFPGWKEHYTGYFPVWLLSYSLINATIRANAIAIENASAKNTSKTR